jgi:ubiquinone/menaquinone biosynthesis C-methylase UbiE
MSVRNKIKGDDCRVLPKNNGEWDSLEEYLLFLKHFAAYDFAKNYVGDKTVLEVGCGEGYGSRALSNCAGRVIGVDSSAEIINLAKEKYREDNLVYAVAEGQKLPFESGVMDVVVSFQVIEHLPPDEAPLFLAEMKRVLKDRGVFISSTPNRKMRLLPFQKPWNAFHLKEYSPEEFKALLGSVFSSVEIKGLYGVGGIEEIETRRVRKIAWASFFAFPLLRPFAKLRSGHKPRLMNYGLEHFRVDSSRVSKCFDLIGVCIK